MSGAPRWITEAEVTSLVTLPDAIAALRRALRAEADGTVHQMVKTHTSWDGATLHAIGAAAPAAGIVVTKTWAHTPGGANPLVVVFDAASGQLRAVIEAFALGQLRTAGISGVATDLLADPASDEMAVFGTGRQALGQVAAVTAVRPLRRVRVWGRDAERAAAFASRVTATLDVRADTVRDVAAAADGAAVLTLVTRATEPFLAATDPDPGTHVNAVGAIVRSRQEFAPELLARCSLVTADSVAAARSLSAELRSFYGTGDTGDTGDTGEWRQVRPLAELVAAGASHPADGSLTLFKAMGTGLSDLALATAVLDRAPTGRPIPPTERSSPRWTTPRKETP